MVLNVFPLRSPGRRIQEKREIFLREGILLPTGEEGGNDDTPHLGDVGDQSRGTYKQFPQNHYVCMVLGELQSFALVEGETRRSQSLPGDHSSHQDPKTCQRRREERA